MADAHDGTPGGAPQAHDPFSGRYAIRDIRGQAWNAMTAVEFRRREGKHSIWLFRCLCGTETEKPAAAVIGGNTKSCGCLKSRARRGLPRLACDRSPEMESLLGQQIGRLVPESEAERNERGERMWNCRCECGGRGVFPHKGLRAGTTRSCGCLHRETSARVARETGHLRRKHGRSGTPEWICWQGMLARCGNPKAKGYARYGGRGIRVCERWLSFEAFLADMGEKPSPAHSIGRIDNDKGYEPGNCRWETAEEQARNRRGMRMIAWRGETLCLTAWAERTGIAVCRIWRRIESGWPLDRALAEKPTRGLRPGSRRWLKAEAASAPSRPPS